MSDIREFIRAASGTGGKATLAIRGGRLVNVVSEEIYQADVAIYGERIIAVGDISDYIGPETRIVDATGKYLAPGMIDGHLHVECSKMSLTSFAKAVVPLGTTSIVTGLDQIIVVGGPAAAREFLDEAKQTPLKVFWGAPCKTPYTMPRSTVGHYFSPADHQATHHWPECVGIWETVREFIQEEDADVLAALELAEKSRLPVLGCCPMTRGARLNGYQQSGVRADHESYTPEEMLEKLRAGMHVVVRESSISHFLADNLRIVTEMGVKALRRISFCTDDVVASDILKRGHLDNMVRMAIAMGISPMAAIQMATINGADALRIDDKVGSISPGRAADILLVDDLRNFTIETVVAKGEVVARNGKMAIELIPPQRSVALLNSVKVAPLQPGDLKVAYHGAGETADAMAIAVTPEKIFVRTRRDVTLAVKDGQVLADPARDVQYVTVVERYGKTSNRPVAFASGFGLKQGAIASSTAPDDNNIICIGADLEDMRIAINHLIANHGGQVVVRNGKVEAFLHLPIGGIVSDIEPAEMAALEDQLDDAARALGCPLPWPFMYMFVLQITAIPEYAITDLGVVDCVGLKVISPFSPAGGDERAVAAE
ncbi:MULTISPECIES: adenine deaminase [unclassified Ensifer]|uniref:adenine deaminase n=1 Tax=unclassified Ensifer TaxID=2633371 RepID=UPI000713F3AF|nr:MULTISPECIES: adenine deaminase [unclassified Ensifer]MBD9543920.1 adenine deaminase [Ensifer sp. ENS04]KQX53851.1 adenosine deaminase [Ensifer sp. Root1298]KQX73013.1 adenosine deaminase [Ensifer sp. Root1312]KRC24135.1 adenosine deaminase [Ensifer sp. Root74]KRD72408.1 adenosine deaminase [Ensifer sp. Root954]